MERKIEQGKDPIKLLIKLVESTEGMNFDKYVSERNGEDLSDEEVEEDPDPPEDLAVSDSPWEDSDDENNERFDRTKRIPVCFVCEKPTVSRSAIIPCGHQGCFECISYLHTSQGKCKCNTESNAIVKIESDSMSKENLCLVCTQEYQNNDTVLRPCGHTVCYDCAQKLSRCRQCNAPVTQRHLLLPPTTKTLLQIRNSSNEDNTGQKQTRTQNSETSAVNYTWNTARQTPPRDTTQNSATRALNYSPNTATSDSYETDATSNFSCETVPPNILDMSNVYTDSDKEGNAWQRPKRRLARPRRRIGRQQLSIIAEVENEEVSDNEQTNVFENNILCNERFTTQADATSDILSTDGYSDGELEFHPTWGLRRYDTSTPDPARSHDSDSQNTTPKMTNDKKLYVKRDLFPTMKTNTPDKSNRKRPAESPFSKLMSARKRVPSNLIFMKSANRETIETLEEDSSYEERSPKSQNFTQINTDTENHNAGVSRFQEKVIQGTGK